MARPRAGCELQERGQGQPNLLAICDNRLTALADLPAGIGQYQIGATDPLEHRARSARNPSRLGVVDKIGVKASRKLQVVSPGAVAARDLFVDVRSDDV